MKFTAQEKSDIEKLIRGKDLLEKLWKQYELLTVDSLGRFRTALKGLVDKLSEEMEGMTGEETTILTNSKDDKQFERVLALIDKSGKVYESLKNEEIATGKIPENQEKLNTLEKLGNRKNGNN